MNTYGIFDLKIKNALEKGFSIGICPLGECGLELKNILNNRYGIEEKFVADNHISRWNLNCLSLNELNISDENTIVIVAVKNNTISKQISDELVKKGYVTDIMFKPSVYPSKNGEFIMQVVELLVPRKVKGTQLVRVGGAE